MVVSGDSLVVISGKVVLPMERNIMNLYLKKSLTKPGRQAIIYLMKMIIIIIKSEVHVNDNSKVEFFYPTTDNEYHYHLEFCLLIKIKKGGIVFNG